MSKNAHIIFLKYPESGKVKTRLGESIGHSKAAEFYRLLVEKILMATVDSTTDILLFIEPYEKLNKFKDWLGGSFKYYPQEQSDLGERMFKALETAFSEGYDKCILTGSDIPELNSDITSDAFEKLDESDAVLGRAEDGGYYLIGFNKNKLTDKVFKGIKWSCENVFDETMRVFNQINYIVIHTEILSDLDTLEDLESMRENLREIIGSTGVL